MTAPTPRPSAAHSAGRLERIGRKVRRSVVRVRGQQALAILGMHRSGTSSLAGSLEDAGLYLGDRDVAGKGKWNAKGNRESKVLMQLHEQVLNANGGSWDDPPARVVWDTQQGATRDKFIRSRSTQRRWGFKDPRTLLVIDGWLEAIPEMGMVGTIRNPAAVAQSLQRRAGSGSPDDWLQLWLDYNERLLALYDGRPFPIIDFDLPADRYQQRLGRLIEELGLQRHGAGDDFFESSLRSPDRPALELPGQVLEVYGRLSDIAADQAAT